MSETPSKRHYTSTNRFNKVEYVDILKGSQVAKRYKTEIEGYSRMQFEELIGKDLGPGLYKYIFKIINEDQTKRGTIRGIDVDLLERKKKEIETKPNNDESEKILSSIQKSFERLENKITVASNSSDNSLSIELIRETYKLQIEFLKTQVDELKSEIRELKKNNDDNSGGGALSMLNNPIVQAVVETLLAKKG